MFKLLKIPMKTGAQAIIEGPVAFILIFLIFFFISEFALYFQSIHANQTLSDDISANISASGTDEDTGENFCKEPDNALLHIIEGRAKKYINKNIKLEIDTQTDDLLILKSNGADDLTLNILCSDTDGYIVRSEYLFRGFFLFRSGQQISGISSVQTPKF